MQSKRVRGGGDECPSEQGSMLGSHLARDHPAPRRSLAPGVGVARRLTSGRRRRQADHQEWMRAEMSSSDQAAATPFGANVGSGVDPGRYLSACTTPVSRHAQAPSPATAAPIHNEH
ncbi:uncharacterized protein LOC134543328 isoform X1 [Bacillus rossius redtenbacheri]|uniref:uncharacterized protein LOC134543328 isoform X1 n=1 Tax=Bacillus rossius redtenbacheri TaxID=93214 RepID=UPI002FDE242A